MLHFHIKSLEYPYLNHSDLALGISIENSLSWQVSNMWNLKKKQTNELNRNRLIENIWTVAIGEVAGALDQNSHGVKKHKLVGK